MLAVFGRIDPHLRRSITFDNDTAFAQHALLRTMRDMTTWFCDAYALMAERRHRKRQWTLTLGQPRR
jgi:IS30 family transposase